ncbi:fibronectin type III domain-containing protein [Butyrivibrio sp. FC2001]|uniref:fibronectin type III domain-containing protein n=1 Tax=Butyrivibrio sp. FC2001 TaxID=1280671 RepID=UPI000416801E|nr:fibronectin type III domain-containing protein [Butyrivibrio sp. FC2001]
MKKVFATGIFSRSFSLLMAVMFFMATPVTSYAGGSDPVYDSMTQKSESMSDFMKKANRYYGHILADTSSPESKRVLSMGAVYLSSGEILPDKFTVYFGKIKLFAYSLSKRKWIVIDSHPYPCGIRIYTLPWENSKSKKCNSITYTDSYAKVDLTKEEMNNCVLHFWGKTASIDKSDYLFYACAFDFWTDEAAAGKFTATSGIDTKNSDGSKTIVQLYSSRGLTTETIRKTQWGHTVPNDVYSEYNTSSLNALFESGQLEPGLYTGKEPKGTVPVDPYMKKTKIKDVTTGRSSLKLKWKKVKSGIDGYEIQYSDNKKFKNRTGSILISKASATSKKFKHIKYGKKFYIRMRTYKNVGKQKVYSKWSKKASAKLNG